MEPGVRMRRVWHGESYIGRESAVEVFGASWPIADGLLLSGITSERTSRGWSNSWLVISAASVPGTLHQSTDEFLQTPKFYPVL